MPIITVEQDTEMRDVDVPTMLDDLRNEVAFDRDVELFLELERAPGIARQRFIIGLMEKEGSKMLKKYIASHDIYLEGLSESTESNPSLEETEFRSEQIEEPDVPEETVERTQETSENGKVRETGGVLTNFLRWLVFMDPVGEKSE
jgi:hypothetical protein